MGRAAVDQSGPDGITALFMACMNGPAVVTALVEARVAVNLANNDGVAPLHTAAEEGHVEVVRLLVSAKARPVLHSGTLL